MEVSTTKPFFALRISTARKAAESRSAGLIRMEVRRRVWKMLVWY
jgi:hypothetical protein